MILEMLFLLVIYSIPLGITLWSMISSYHKYPSYAIFRVIIITLLVGLWVYTSIPWMVNIESLSDNQLILIAHIGSIAGAIARIMIATSFTKSDLGVIVHRTALYSIVFTSMLIGIRLLEFLQKDSTYFGIQMVEGEWREYLHPIVELILLTSLISLFAAFFLTIKLQKNIPKPLFDADINSLYIQVLVLLVVGGSISLLNQFIIIDYYPEYYNFMFVISRFCVLFGFLLLAQFISLNPIFIFQEKSNMMKPIDQGIIGWMISYNGDLGPETLLYSNQFQNKFDIQDNEFASFSASVITVIGITKSFYSSVFMLPFSSRDLFSSLNISFKIHEPSLKDPRLNQQALSVISIIFPNSLVAKIRGFDDAEELLLNRLKDYSTLNLFAKTEVIDKLTSDLLSRIIS